MSLAAVGPAHTDDHQAPLGHEREESSDVSQDSGSEQGSANVYKMVFLVQAGDRAERQFKAGDSIQQVKQALVNDWPDNFPPKPSALSDLRILYRGHFLDDKMALSGKAEQQCNMQPAGTIVHLTIRPSSKKEKGAKKDVDKAPKCTCTIL
ncbi:hypothetical protein GGI07_000193 [Coemansia sp. Benny D115]|nr:hypothetical protein GGI07_000193 [Coemansia sp. Benny D115]